MNMLARAALMLFAFLAAPALAQSDPYLVGLPAASSVAGDELLTIYQGGQRAVTTLSAACSTRAAFAGSAVVGLPGAGAIAGDELVVLYQGRTLSLSTVAAVCSTRAAFAGSTTVGLPGTAALTGAELVPLYQGGRRMTATVAQISTLSGVATATALDFSDPNNSAFIL